MLSDNIHNPQDTKKLDNNYIIIDFIQNKQLIHLQKFPFLKEGFSVSYSKWINEEFNIVCSIHVGQ